MSAGIAADHRGLRGPYYEHYLMIMDDLASGRRADQTQAVNMSNGIEPASLNVTTAMKTRVDT